VPRLVARLLLRAVTAIEGPSKASSLSRNACSVTIRPSTFTEPSSSRLQYLSSSVSTPVWAALASDPAGVESNDRVVCQIAVLVFDQKFGTAEHADKANQLNQESSLLPAFSHGSQRHWVIRTDRCRLLAMPRLPSRRDEPAISVHACCRLWWYRLSSYLHQWFAALVFAGTRG